MASRLLFPERDTRRPVAISNESAPATATDAPGNCDDPDTTPPTPPGPIPGFRSLDVGPDVFQPLQAADVPIRDVLATFRVHAGSMSAFLTQTAARRYRSEVLDPLLIVHDYAFHPVYGELRRVAARCRPPIQLSREFWTRALGARWHATVAERDRSHPDSSLREEWRRVAATIPAWRGFRSEGDSLQSGEPFVLMRNRGLSSRRPRSARLARETKARDSTSELVSRSDAALDISAEARCPH